jgi:N utilization substance protein A
VAKIKYSADIMKYISLFESFTGAKVKDCIVSEEVIFIIQENEMGKAIGKHGHNIKRIGNVLKKKIRLVEFSNSIPQFVGNLIYPLKAKEIKEENGIIIIYGQDTKTKSLLIGRNRHNIGSINDIVKRYFDVIEIKVV